MGRFTFNPLVANELRNDRAISLLDPALVVFVGDAAAGKSELFTSAVGHQLLIDELAPVIRVDPEQREWKQAARPLQRVHYSVLAPVQQWQALRPRRGDVGQRERV